MKGRFVLLFRRGVPPPGQVEDIYTDPRVTVLDSTAGRALLVEAEDDVAADLRLTLDGWIVDAVVEHPPPGPSTPWGTTRATQGDATDSRPE